jgi:hypothetical protein
MAVFRFTYGIKHYCVRVGFGSRPLVYAVYMYDREDALPNVPGQIYRPINSEQYDWLLNHLMCDVSYTEGDWPGRTGNLQCRTHGSFFKLFDDAPIVCDWWDDRQV